MTFLPSRIEQAITSRSILGEDFFGGWQPQDRELFEKYSASSQPIDGQIIDYFGVKTRAAFHPWASGQAGTVAPNPPIPDDGLRAEAIEYFATLDAIERAASEFSVIELGASYAPWACFSAVIAKKIGKTLRSITAVEASSYLFDLIPVHFADNGLDPQANFVALINAAVTSEYCTLHFPKVSNPGENGGRVETNNVEADYLGRKIEHDEVQGIPLAGILPDHIIDLIHIDVQGVEVGVLTSAIGAMNDSVRSIFIGTHSRKIEGELLELFHKNGWNLIRERPTKYIYEESRPDIVGWTTRDGGQYWVNPKI